MLVPRKFSLYSAYSFGTAEVRQRSPASEARKIEEDLETVLDTTEVVPPYDETGKRTYERACRKVGVTPAAHCLRNLEDSQALDLQYYGLGPRSVIPVAMALMVNNQITSLNLQGNSLTEKGVVYIQKMMEDNNSITDIENTSLKVLNCSWNGMEDEGAIAMGRALGHNGVLQELDISCNRVSPQGFLELIKGLARNDTLEVLKVGMNNISDAGAEMAVDLMKRMSNLNLRRLDLSDVILGSAINPRLEELKEVHPDLEFAYGYTDSYGKRKLNSYDMVQEALDIMREYCQQKNMTLVELFAKFDTDGSMSVTHEEFREGLKEAKIPVTPLHVDRLIEALDQDGDGEIDFSELVIGAEEKGGKGSAKPSKDGDGDGK
nr:hypothetical protein BaRGS_020327 [Batillaria attramentaria]